jgi:hypothetical protein
MILHCQLREEATQIFQQEGMCSLFIKFLLHISQPLSQFYILFFHPRFLRYLVEQLHLPAYCLVDSDPYGFDILATYKFGSLVGMIYLMLLCSSIAIMNLTFLADSQVKIAINEFMDMIIYCTFRPNSPAILASLLLKVLLLYEVPLAVRLCVRTVPVFLKKIIMPILNRTCRRAAYHYIKKIIMPLLLILFMKFCPIFIVKHGL